MPLQVKGEKKQEAPKPTEKVQANAKAVEDVKAGMPVQEVNSEVVGSKSATLHFIAALGDPSRDDVTPIVVNGKKEKKVDPTIVGYQFKSDVDLQVPNVMPGDGIKNNLMSYTGDTTATVLVKAGTPFNLTKFETGMLISREEYNGRATGGEKQVLATYTISAKKASDGSLAKASSATAIPSVSLRAVTGSIKDYAMIPVLNFTKEKGANGTTKKTRTIIKGFEKFEGLCKESVRATGDSRGGSSTATNTRNKGAAAFLQIASAKKAN